MSKIGIILGSDSDLPYMEKGIQTLKEFNIPFEIEVSSAHRTPHRTIELVKDFEKKGIRVIIAAAGGAAHLPGMIASYTLLPVLGVPITSALSGLDSLYSIVQMPSGIPVAAFSIGSSGGVNSVLFAVEILALQDQELKNKLIEFREKQKMNVLEKSSRLKEKIKSEMA
ncbi:MAG: 5-(carboxyamino)imidazole ribonucleotide mutase [Candidatus Aminicenantes bacterium]|nr:MAG: 5-(carboxyamino)imidazole ribonucleotide mutase [Candidatus Aminicenantes bacterium]